MDVGIDISYWNGKFDFSKALQQQVKVCYIKASQAEFKDPKFLEHSTNCTIPYKSGYHFLDYEHFPAGGELVWGAKQAQFFVKTMGDWNNLRGCLDIEDMSGFGWKPIYQNLGSVTKICRGFVDEHKKLTGFTPIFYMSSGLASAKDYLGKYVWRNFIDCPLWVANYNKITNPPVGAWTDWVMWQYTSEGDGLLYGNAIGNKFIDLNHIKDLTPLLTSEPVTKKWVDFSIEEKLEALRKLHPEIV